MFKFLLTDSVGVGILFGSQDNNDATGGALEVPEDQNEKMRLLDLVHVFFRVSFSNQFQK